jgi:uncharacterized surface protein with fasciclin (FAS1) repeats
MPALLQFLHPLLPLLENYLPEPVETLVKPENEKTMTAILTYHLVAGRLDSRELAKLIKAENGKVALKTVNRETLTAIMKGNNIVLKGTKRGMSKVTIKDVYQSNGIIHFVNTVVMP